MANCLIIEDSPAVQDILIRLIESVGETVIGKAANAEQGLSRLAKATPDIVFLDWDLPQLAALDFLKGVAEAQLPSVPHIVLCAMENDAQQFALARAVGARFHLIKPYDRHDVGDIFGLVRKAELMDQQAAVPQAPVARTA